MEPEFFDKLSKHPKISNFIKIRPVELSWFHADGRADVTKVIVASIYQPTNAHKISHKTILKHSDMFRSC